MNVPPDLSDLPVLTDVIERGPGWDAPSPVIGAAPAAGLVMPAGLASADLLGSPPALDMAQLEQRLIEELMQRFQHLLQERVHASVAPAVSLLADRIAYKAAQEVAGDLAERMREDLEAAVRQALDDTVHGRR